MSLLKLFMISSLGVFVLFNITENFEDWQPMELLKIREAYFDPMMVQFLDHDWHLELLVMQWKGYDTCSNGDAVVGLNM